MDRYYVQLVFSYFCWKEKGGQVFSGKALFYDIPQQIHVFRLCRLSIVFIFLSRKTHKFNVIKGRACICVIVFEGKQENMTINKTLIMENRCWQIKGICGLSNFNWTFFSNVEQTFLLVFLSTNPEKHPKTKQNSSANYFLYDLRPTSVRHKRI